MAKGRSKLKEGSMNKDRVEGKMKDVGGRVERQVGEWTGDADKQARGAMTQAEGKVQNAWGRAKDAGKKAAENLKHEHEKDAPENDQRVARLRPKKARKFDGTRRKAS
jgi:uncharacterized protein YjbJ (UPF0337 family)